jgi:hypothetical protein
MRRGSNDCGPALGELIKLLLISHGITTVLYLSVIKAARIVYNSSQPYTRQVQHQRQVVLVIRYM